MKNEFKWISVKDSLPDKDSEYLCMKDCKMYTAPEYYAIVLGYDFDGKYFYYLEGDCCFQEATGVDYWAQIPELD